MSITLAQIWFLAGPAVAMAVVAVGVRASRQGRIPGPAVGALAAGMGWAVLAYGGGWRMVIWPRTVLEHLVLPALVLGVCAGFGRSRWVAFGGAWFAAWWLAGAGVVGEAFWRVLFGGLFVVWVLVRGGGRVPGRIAASGLAVAGAAAVVGMNAWAGAGLVLAGVSLIMAAGGRGVSVPAALGMLVIVGAELGAGRVLRGGFGVMDLACLGAVVLPGLVPWAERRLRRLGRRGAAVAAPVVTAGAVVGLAVLVARLR